VFLEFINRPEFQITRKHNVSDTESLSVSRLGVKPTLLGPLETTNLNHSRFLPALT
jgi:hypothetical protein